MPWSMTYIHVRGRTVIMRLKQDTVSPGKRRPLCLAAFVENNIFVEKGFYLGSSYLSLKLVQQTLVEFEIHEHHVFKENAGDEGEDGVGGKALRNIQELDDSPRLAHDEGAAQLLTCRCR